MLLHLLASLLLAQAPDLPTRLAQDPPAAPPRENPDNDFAINVNLWPLLESTTLPDGNRRTSLWPLFHVTTMPQGGVHSWHALNYLWGPNYHMLLPFYYRVDEHLGILPPLVLTGPDYFLAPPLLSGQWRHADGDLTTWVTPLFHVTKTPDGDVRSLHAGPFLVGEDYWALPPLLSAAWTADDGSRTSWITPLYHRSTGKDGALVRTHVGPYFQGTDYWFVLPLAGSGTHEDGGTSTWITPLFHVTKDKQGDVQSYHIGPYISWEDGWSIWPLLMRGWNHGDNGFEMTIGSIFWLEADKEGLSSTSLCPVYWWKRDSHWFVLPLVSGQWGREGGAQTTWVTPLFHRTTDDFGSVESFHVGPYFEGKDYWAVPPLFSWHVRYEDDVETTWLTPLFHRTTDAKGDAESSHLFPAYFWERDEYWVAPPILSAGWTSKNGDRTAWGTPFFHWTQDSDGLLLNMHLGPYLQGEDYWGLPPLLTGSWGYPGGARTTWVTPLFHLTTDPRGDVDSLHVGPYFQGKDYWAIPPLLSWHTTHQDRSESTWLTPAFHLNVAPDGRWSSAHLFPALFWKRDAYWVAPPLLSAQWRHQDGAWTTWATPLFHATETADGSLRSMHVAPVWFWERDRYWAIPPLLSGGGTHDDGARTTWITPLFHYTEDKAGSIESFHTFPAFFWKRDDYWLAPLLLSGGFTRPDGSSRTWISPFYHEDYEADGSLRSRHALTYFEGPSYHHVFPVFWDWTSDEERRHTLLAPPLFVRTEEANGDVTSSLPWPLLTWRHGKEVDTSIGMELRPFLFQSAGDQYEFNFLWRLFSVLGEEESTRVMVGPLWYSEKPRDDRAMTKFQILGGLFARDCNYETERYRYRLLWFIPLGSSPMHDPPTK